MTTTDTDRKVFTREDLERDGADQVLAQLRAQFEATHAPYRQYQGWTAGTVLAVATCQIRSRSRYVMVEAGDVLLMKPDPYAGRWGCLDPDHTYYIPRRGYNARLTYGVRRLDQQEVA